MGLEESAELVRELRKARVGVEQVARTLAWIEARPAILALVDPDADRPAAALVRSAITARRLRTQYFPPWPPEPGWSLVLELHLARLEGRCVAQGELFEATGVAPTTGLRRLDALCRAGFARRSADPGDGRRALISLSDDAAEHVASYFAAALTVLPFIP